MELYEMPCAMLQVLYTIAYEKMKSEEGKQQIQAEEMEDALEEGGLIP
jgi:hypothetical protein